MSILFLISTLNFKTYVKGSYDEWLDSQGYTGSLIIGAGIVSSDIYAGGELEPFYSYNEDFYFAGAKAGINLSYIYSYIGLSFSTGGMLIPVFYSEQGGSEITGDYMYSTYLTPGIALFLPLSKSIRLGLLLEKPIYLNLANYSSYSLSLGVHFGRVERKPPVVARKEEKKEESIAKTPVRRMGLPPYLLTEVEFKDENHDGMLEAYEKADIILKIKNEGRGAARDLRVIASLLENIKGLDFFSGKEKVVDLVDSGREKEVIIPVRATEDVPDALVSIRVDVKEPHFGADADPALIKFRTKKLEPPDIEITSIGVDDDREGDSFGNSNGQIEPGETVEISAIIQNKGTGGSRDTRLIVKGTDDVNVMFMGTDTVIEIGDLAPQEWKKITIPYYVNKRIKKDSFSINLLALDKREKFNKELSMTLRLNQKMKSISEIVVEAKRSVKERKEVAPPPELTVDVDIDIPETKNKRPDDIAVIIYAKDYRNPDIPDVEYADRDGAVMKEYLIKAFGFKEGNIIVLRDPTKGDLEGVFGTQSSYKGQLYNYVKPGKSSVFIYYVGHGAPDVKTRQGYLVPVDCNPSYIEIQGYPLETFYKNLSNIPAKKYYIVMDACFSGQSNEGMIIKEASPLVLSPITGSIPDNAVVITSSQADQISSWYPDKRHSLFTYYFLKGLKGEADSNKDRKITVGELKAYLNENVSYMARRLYGREQEPFIKGEDEEVILKY